MKTKNGFTLIELLIAMAITGIASAGIFAVFQSQQKSYITQENVAVMQQNLRAGMDMMVRDIRMAGCDPTKKANAGIISATTTSINFTMDVTGGEADGIDNDKDGLIDEPDEYSDEDTGDSNENITYALYTANGIQQLGRKSTAAAINQSVAEYIEAIEFFYTLEDGSTSLTPAAANLDEIRSIQITMLARTDRSDQKIVNNRTYTAPGGTAWPYNDNFRRRLLTTIVKCRNMGL